MLWSIRYWLLCWLLRLLVRCGLDELDLETDIRLGVGPVESSENLRPIL